MILMISDKDLKPNKRSVRGFSDHIIGTYECGDGRTLIGSDLAWCREISSDTLRKTASHYRANPYPELTFDLHGARSHRKSGAGYEGGNDTKYVRGKPSQWVDGAVRGWLALVSMALDVIFNPDTAITEFDFHVMSAALTCNLRGPKLTTTNIGLNAELLADIQGPHIGRGNRPYGSLVNIPIVWAQSRAVTSYLMYMTRVWGALYRHKVSALVGKHQAPAASVICLIPASRVDQLDADALLGPWRAVAKQLLAPSWYFSLGRARMWGFTYHLFRLAFQILDGHRPSDALDRLCDSCRDGFLSWMHYYAKDDRVLNTLVDNLVASPFKYFPPKALE